MLSEDQNRLLTQVGPGTPMGNLLRRYWHPIGGESEFDDADDPDGSPDGRESRSL